MMRNFITRHRNKYCLTVSILLFTHQAIVLFQIMMRVEVKLQHRTGRLTVGCNVVPPFGEGIGVEMASL